MKFDEYEAVYLKKGYKYICGVDEAGRGPLAGPVSACALIPNLNEKIIEEVNDSKALSDKKRRSLYPYIIEQAISYKCKLLDNFIIDEINILEATKQCMKNAVLELLVKPDIVLIDAVKLTLPYKTLSIIHGDALSYAIAAASIIAKVERDDIMIECANRYPDYGFEEHKGYGTKHHIEMLLKYGPCEIHRKSFIKKIFQTSFFEEII